MEHRIHYFAKNQSDSIIGQINNPRQKLIALIMLDCGLRVSECVSLQYKNFNFRDKALTVKSLKKRRELSRTIPLSDRLYAQLAEYVTDKRVTPDAWLFPGSGDSHVTRFAVNKYLDRYAERKDIPYLHPHALRHSFATQHLIAGTPLENIKTMLGHVSFDTTLVYAHIPQHVLRQNIDNLGNKTSFLKRILKPKTKPVINLSFDGNEIIIGRNAEIKSLADNASRKINTLVTGEIGVGKSCLLKQLETCRLDSKILKLDDVGNIKKSLVNILIYLYNGDKEALFNVIHANADKEKTFEKITRESTKNISEEIIKVTRKHEYILLIDSLDDITNKAVRTLEFLKDHFVIIAAAREVKVDKSSFLWNFDVIRMKNMTRKDALTLISRLSCDLQTSDFELFRNHVYEQSAGNPRAVKELCDRYKKEPILDVAVIRSITHRGARKELDCTFVIILFLALVTCLRYLNHEVGDKSFRFIGGCAMALMLLSRYFMKGAKRKLF